MTKIKGFKRLEKRKQSPAVSKKIEDVDSIAEKIKKATTIAIIDQRALPDKLLQKARKQLKTDAEFIMAKNTVLKRALKKGGKEDTLINMLNSPTVLVLSNKLSPYALHSYFKKNKTPVAAKPGQVAIKDIIIPAGETDLPPGPALSELKGAGINAMIKGGKIAVQKDSTVAKEGEKITDNVSKALQTLNILPFQAGLTMVAGYEDGTIYMSEILDVDVMTMTADLKASIQDAYSMSINIAYPTTLNIEHLLSMAVAQGRGVVSETGTYSEAHMESLLSKVLGLQIALESKVGDLSKSDSAEEKKEEEKQAEGDGKAEGPKDEKKQEEKPAQDEKKE
jgi:large subunit ribosomal protein L10